MDRNSFFTFRNQKVKPGETKHSKIKISQTYLGDPIRMPVSIINSKNEGPTMFLTAAVHGDELNGVETVRSVAREWDHTDIYGTIICLPVLNVPGFLNQQREIPIHSRDLNRAFPGNDTGKSSSRIASIIWEEFISKADFGIDIHTSTRGRSNMHHVRADMENDKVERLARSYGSHVIINSEGSEGTIRREATEEGIPTITVEMGQAHRFEREEVEKSLKGVKNVFAEYGIHSQKAVNWPGWTEVIEGWDEKTWIRADSGGLVDIEKSVGELVEEDEIICKISNPFETNKNYMKAPFTGLIVGALLNPVVYPGNPIFHFVEPQEDTISIIRKTRNNN